MKKLKVKDLIATGYDLTKHKDSLSEPLTLQKKWIKNDVEKCIVTSIDGYEYVILSENLETIKTKSNKKTKK
jgi:hypothetical protein